jgi:hypothetical protein
MIVELSRVVGTTKGAIEGFDYVDGLPALVPHYRHDRVPKGAPIVACGWADAPLEKTAPLDVRVVLDGSRMLSPEVDAGGFRVVVPTADLVPGGHDIRVYVRGRDDGWYEAAYRPFLVYEPAVRELERLARPLRLRVERVSGAPPLPQFEDVPAIPNGHFALIAGWAFDVARSCGPQGVAVLDKLGRMWSGPLDVARPELRGMLDARDDRLGFEIAVPTDALGRGRWDLRVHAVGEDGRLFESGVDAVIDVAGALRRFPFTARETAAAPRFSARISERDDAETSFIALGAERTIEVVRGSDYLIEGWALDANGNGADDVFVEIGETTFVTSPHRLVALAGYRRDEDVPRALGEPPVPDAWFTCPFETRELAPRAYTLDLVVAAPDRRTIARARLGMLLVVEPPGGAAVAARPR